MRYKSLPLTVRHPSSRPSHAPPPAPAPRARRRIIDWLATLPILLLLPAVVAVSEVVEAATPTLEVKATVTVGEQVTVHGRGYRPDAKVDLVWTGSRASMPSVTTDASGAFSIEWIVPKNSQVGEHEMRSVYRSGGRTQSGAREVVARAAITVRSAPLPTPTASSAVTAASPRPSASSSASAASASASASAASAATATGSPSGSAASSATATPQDQAGESTDAAGGVPSSTPSNATPRPTTAPATSAPSAPASAGPTPAPAPTSGCSVVVSAGGSVANAMKAARAGQTICLRGGTYAQSFSLDPPNGSPAARITLTSYPGERAVVAGLVSLSGLDYWTISNMGFTWNGGGYDQHMVKITGGSGWMLDRVEMWGARSFANLLVAGAPHGWTIRNSVFRDTFGGESDGSRSHNLYVFAPNGSGGLIASNVFRNAPRGNNVKLSGSSLGTDGTDNVTFRGNSLSGANRANLLIGNAANNNVVEGNHFSASNDGWAIRLWDLRGSGNVVRNNVYANPTLCSDYESPVKCSQVVGSGNTR